MKASSCYRESKRSTNKVSLIRGLQCCKLRESLTIAALTTSGTRRPWPLLGTKSSQKQKTCNELLTELGPEQLKGQIPDKDR